MKIGITGLPYVGKTTVLNALTGTIASSSRQNKPNVSVVKVPDERIDTLSRIFDPKKTAYADLTFIDTAGIVSSDKKGSSGGSIVLQSINQVDAIAAVINLFADEEASPEQDMELIETEFMISDLSVIENRLVRIEKQSKGSKGSIDKEEYDLLVRCKESVENGHPLRTLEFTEQETKLLRGFQFLSLKSLLYIFNISEDKLGKESETFTAACKEYINKPNTASIAICGKIEFEISQLGEEDAREFLEEMGIAESGLSKVIRSAYTMLRLISFFTVGKDEVRAWTIKEGETAVSAAGVIHSDIERGFIRAEIIHCDDFIQCGSFAEAKNKGLLRLEGKDYVVKDGDIANFRFNV